MKRFVKYAVVAAAVGATLFDLAGTTSAGADDRAPLIDDYYTRRAAARAARQAEPTASSFDETTGFEQPADRVAPASAIAPRARGAYDEQFDGESLDYAAARSGSPRSAIPAVYDQGQYVDGGSSAGAAYDNSGEFYEGEYYGDGAYHGDGEFYGGDCDACGDYGCESCGDPVCADLYTRTHPGTRLWVAVDYLSWWGREAYLPPLVTTSPPGTSQGIAGVLGEPTTTILFGQSETHGEQQNGGRIQARYWLVDGQFLAVEGDYFMLEHNVTQYGTQSEFGGGATGGRILARPFYDALSADLDARLLAFPNLFDAFGQMFNLDGGVNIVARSEVQGAGAGLRHLLWIDFDHCKRLFVVGGFRYYRFVDRLQIQDSRQLSLSTPIDFRIDSTDFFGVENEFYGGEIGLACEMQHGCFSLDVLGRVALGDNHQVISIDGYTTTHNGSSAETVSGGLLAQPSNIGHHRDDDFAIIPEVQVNLGYQLTCRVKARIGYTMIYWFDALRAGNQVDLTLNTNQANDPNPAVPTVPFSTTDWWLQGVNAGLECQF